MGRRAHGLILGRARLYLESGRIQTQEPLSHNLGEDEFVKDNVVGKCWKLNEKEVGGLRLYFDKEYPEKDFSTWSQMVYILPCCTIPRLQVIESREILVLSLSSHRRGEYRRRGYIVVNWGGVRPAWEALKAGPALRKQNNEEQ